MIHQFSEHLRKCLPKLWDWLEQRVLACSSTKTSIRQLKYAELKKLVRDRGLILGTPLPAGTVPPQSSQSGGVILGSRRWASTNSRLASAF